jgi:zinc/manganese transport system substrate-binding protein
MLHYQIQPPMLLEVKWRIINMRLASIFAFFLIGIMALAVNGCESRAGKSTARIQIVATTSIIGDWVKNVAGDQIDLKTLVGPDGDPHEYQPAPSDSVAVMKSQLIFENGFGLENWLDKIYVSSQSKADRVVISNGIEARKVSVADCDPHAWQNVKDAAIMVGNIRDALIKSDPTHADEYKSRGDAYIKQLTDLDGWVQEQINTIPKGRRKLVTSHDAFGYFGERYGMEIPENALESVTTEASDPSARQIIDAINEIKKSGVPVIFVENIQNPKLMNQIAAEAYVKVGPPLYTDALGQPGTDGDTYIKMIQYNVRTLVNALKE